MRYTLSEPARREVLARLLRLNHERWEEEQKMKDEGGRVKAEKKPRGKKAGGEGQAGLL